MKQRKILSVILALAMVLTLLPVTALADNSIEYDGKTYELVSADRLSTSCVGGVTATTGLGAVTFSTSLTDTSDWTQNSGEGSTQSYTYCGVYVTMPTGANSLQVTTDAASVKNFTNHNSDSAFLQGGKYQGWFPVGNCENNVFSLFADGREYIVLLKWYSSNDCTGDVLSQEYVKVTRNIAEGADGIKRAAISSDRLSVATGQDGVTLTDGTLHIPDGYTNNYVTLNVTVPTDSSYKGFHDADGKHSIASGASSVTTKVYFSDSPAILNLEWYSDEALEQAVYFETASISIVKTATSYEAQIGKTKYATLEEAVSLASAGATIELLKDIDLTKCIMLDKSVTIQGNNHKITSTADRIIRLTQPDLDIKIYDCDLISACTAASDVRGISLDYYSGCSLLLDHCNVSASFYAINLMSGTKDVSVTIQNGSTITGYAAINCYAENSTFFIKDSTLIGLNDKSAIADGDNDFATISLDGYGYYKPDTMGTSGCGNTINISGSTIKTITKSTNKQYWLINQSGAMNNKVYVDSASSIIDQDGQDVTDAIFAPSSFTDVNEQEHQYSPNHYVSVQKTAESYQLFASAGQSVTLPAAVSKDGYTFAGWSDGTAVYSASGAYTMPESGTITLTAQWNVISSGSSGGSSSGSSTETTTNPDGSTTTTVTRPDGSTTETTKNPDGSKEVVETAKDGTVTTTTTDADGNKTKTVENTDGSSQTTVTMTDGSTSTTTVDENGLVNAQVAIHEDVVADAQETGETIALPIPMVASSADVESAPVVAVDLASENASAKVEIPVADVTPSVVAVRMLEDGSQEIVKTAIPTENGLALTLSHGDIVKIVDNSKEFTDVSDGYWGSDGIAFAASRELFTGTGENTFSPEADMNRAMILTVLARYEGVDTTGGDTWYDQAVTWAVEKGVSDGSDLTGSLTREQLATMLYRYVGEPAVSGSLSAFTDSASVSGYAADAMAWAVQNGIIGGVGDSRLAPQSTATRAQVATILARFVAAMN